MFKIDPMKPKPYKTEEEKIRATIDGAKEENSGIG